MATDLNSKADVVDEKPDINDVPMEENEVRRNTLLFADLCTIILASTPHLLAI